MKPRVLTPDEWLGLLPKPQAVMTDRVDLTANDVLVVCAGFEERAVAAIGSACRRSRGFDVVVVHYRPAVDENRGSEILGLCEKASVKVVELTYDRENPAGFGSMLVRQLSERTGRIVVDISAMSRLLIVQILVALAARASGLANCEIVYTEAGEYPPTEAEVEAEIAKATDNPSLAVLCLSSGVFEVTVVPELASVAPPGTQTRLVVYPSLDAHQLTAVRAEIHPSRFDLIEGEPPSQRNAWRRSAIARLNQLDEVPNSRRLVASTLDYAANLDLLLRVYWERGERERLLVSPTGSKMQTVAVGIFRAFVRDIQIVYPTPRTFLRPSHYTVGVGRMHSIPLSALAGGNDHIAVA